MKETIERHQKAYKHNVELVNEYTKGEEGVDYVVKKEGIADNRVANINKIKADVRAEINALKLK